MHYIWGMYSDVVCVAVVRVEAVRFVIIATIISVGIASMMTI